MKLFLSFLFFGCIWFTGSLVFSGVGGIGGGSQVAMKYVIIRVCDGGEAGNQCREVRLNGEYFDENGNIKQPSNMDPAPCLIYEGEGIPVQCKPEIEYHIPKFLQKLNNIFGNQGQPIKQADPNPIIN